jgi:hypothetical protein
MVAGQMGKNQIALSLHANREEIERFATSYTICQIAARPQSSVKPHDNAVAANIFETRW